MQKNIQLLLLLFFISLSTLAQSKVGTIDVDFILSKMPELPAVQKSLKAYGETLDKDLQEKYKTYESLLTAYQQNETNLTEDVRKEKQNELLTLEDDISKFRQNGTQLINIRRDEELRPLYQKIGAALEKIATTEKFTQILQKSDAVVYTDPEYDITLAVCLELGITIQE